MKALAVKSSSQESSTKNQVKSAQNQTQTTALANVTVIPGSIPIIQRKSL
jgi:hypothetical protein